MAHDLGMYYQMHPRMLLGKPFFVILYLVSWEIELRHVISDIMQLPTTPAGPTSLCAHNTCPMQPYCSHTNHIAFQSYIPPTFSERMFFIFCFLHQAALALSTLEEIGSLDPQVALALLHLCSGFCKLIHIARVTPLHLILNAMQHYDMDIHHSFTNCAGIYTSDTDWKQVKMSLSL